MVASGWFLATVRVVLSAWISFNLFGQKRGIRTDDYDTDGVGDDCN